MPDLPRLVVLTAPSGAGKTTIAHRLLDAVPALRFSVSATTRTARAHERDGRDYHFVSADVFRAMVERGELLEYEEVYPGRFYGTPLAELSRVGADGLPRPVLLDVDVQGALHVKQQFEKRALTLFIAPPGLDVLEARLRARGTETEASLATRLAKARHELAFAARFDHVIVNDTLERAVGETLALVRSFLAT